MKTRHPPVFLWVWLVIGLLWPLPVYSQPPASPIGQTTSASSTLVRQLTELAQKNHALYLVEGELAQEEVPIKQDQSSRSATSNPLNDLAVRFSYRTERLPGGIVVFHKTYYDERDLPSVTLGECLASFKDAERIIEAVNPHVPSSGGRKIDPLVEGILNTFEPEQLAAMRRGQDEVEARANGTLRNNAGAAAKQNGLPVRSLNPQQKAEVWRVARYLYVQGRLDTFGGAFESIQNLADSPPVFLFHDVNGLRAFGYEVRGKFVPLSHPYQLPSELQRAYPTWMIGRGGDTIPFQFDPTKPRQNHTNVPPTAPEAVSLQTLINRLNAQENVSSAPAKAISIDKDLAAKRICVIGDINGVTPIDVVRAAAALYGLRVVSLPDSIVLTRVRARISENAALTSAAIEEIIPLPFLSACRQAGRPDDPANQKVTFVSGGAGDSVPPSIALQWAAVRRLRETLERKINTAPDKQISFANLDDAEKEAFAVAVGASCLRPLDEFVQTPVPSFIANFEQTVLLGGEATAQDGRKWFGVSMGKRLPNGNLSQGGSGFATPIFHNKKRPAKVGPFLFPNDARPLP